jgi:hypothetical protein
MTTVDAMNSPPHSARSSKLTIAVLGALGVLLMSVGRILVALQFQSQRLPNVSPWHMLTFLAHLTTGMQVLQFLSWAAITGLMIGLGFGASAVTRTRAVTALAAGALVPVGLVVVAHQLNRIWPDTTGPTQVPAMGCLLSVYSLGVPWTLGRLILRWVRPYPQQTMNTIKK